MKRELGLSHTGTCFKSSALLFEALAAEASRVAKVLEISESDMEDFIYTCCDSLISGKSMSFNNILISVYDCADEFIIIPRRLT